MSKRKSKYEDKQFVIVRNRQGARLGGQDQDQSCEGGTVAHMLSGLLFPRDEWMRLTEIQIRSRKGYRSRGGSDYAHLEAGKRWATYMKKGIIIKVK